MALVAFESSNAIRRFYFALVGALYDGRQYEGSGILYRVVDLRWNWTYLCCESELG